MRFSTAAFLAMLSALATGCRNAPVPAAEKLDDKKPPIIEVLGAKWQVIDNLPHLVEPTKSCENKVWQIRIEDLLGGGDPKREIQAKKLVRLSDGQGMKPGKYFWLRKTSNDPDLKPIDLIVEPDDEDCARLQLPTYDMAVGTGVIVMPSGIHTTGIGDLDLFVEEPEGSGNYVIKFPAPSKKK